MTETTQEERDELREATNRTGAGYKVAAYPSELISLLNDADRLEAIERQVIYRTEDVPEWAEVWEKCRNGQCLWDARDARAPVVAPDLRPNLEGPATLPIIDAPNPGEEE